MTKLSIRMILVNLDQQFDLADDEYIEDVQYKEHSGQFRVFIVKNHTQYDAPEDI